nr:4-alpha-glucanotransferase [Clostridia bacterium]
ILLHVTSLPGPYGTGTLGAPAAAFARRLGAAGIRYWQMLPLCPPDSTDSPYQSLSAFAGNPLLIDPAELAATGRVSAEEAEACRCGCTGGGGDSGYSPDERTADFRTAARKRDALLRLACSRLTHGDRERVRGYADRERLWLPDFARFMAARSRFGGRPWWEWPDEGLRRRTDAALAEFDAASADEIFFQMYVQYEFAFQWNALQAAAHSSGVRLFGDMPIYVSRNSSDVWSRSELFEMDEALAPLRVAGVPPDYFSEDGQLWGNPLYDWGVAGRDGYTWWLSRIDHALRLFDAVRIDHFRGFEAYWAVAADRTNAREGIWENGPGMDLFRRVAARFPDAEIIAEDLGLLTARTLAFLAETGYPGMRVMQFAFDGSPDNAHLPYNHPVNSVAYIGTHDNDTLSGWLERESPDAVRRSARYCRAESDRPADICRAWIQTLWSSPARLAVATAQDLLVLDGSRRMNVPGVAEGNWTFRLTASEMDAIDFAWLRLIGATYGRLSADGGVPAGN